jgi:hypothetical protein
MEPIETSSLLGIILIESDLLPSALRKDWAGSIYCVRFVSPEPFFDGLD